MKKTLGAAGFALLLTVLLAGCGAGKTASSSSSSSNNATTQASKRNLRDLVGDCKKRGLPVQNLTDVQTADLPSTVKATSGVQFVGGTKTNMMLLRFGSDDATNTARNYYVGQSKRVYAKSQMLLVADYGMAKDWFAKYQRAIYR